MKKIISVLTIIGIIVPSITRANYENEGMQKFIVTAYYSPLPDQEYYLRGNYEDEVILNGAGIRGASGKGVYPGMLAGPKKYEFGTKIYLSGVGIGSIDDRGGAIVGSGSRGYDGDRIDIWMGYGDEGLKRALTWGKRTVYGKILDTKKIDEEDLIDLEKFKVGKINLSKAKNKNEILPESLTKNSSIEDIKKGQQIFKDLGFYNGEINGTYDRLLIDAIADFQINNNLLQSSFDKAAGSFGPKTKQKLKEIYIFYTKEKQEKEKEDLEKQKELAKLSKKSKEIVDNFGNPKINEVGVHVRLLQKTMKTLGYFEAKETAIFGAITQESLIKYQLDKGIIKSKDDKIAGTLEKNTKKVLQEDLEKILAEKKL